MSNKYKLSTLQKCPIHGCHISPIPDRKEKTIKFKCSNSSLCSWVSSHEYLLRNKYNTIMEIQSLINKIINSYSDSKKRKEILASTMMLADYI